MGVEINPLPNFANKKVLPAAYDDSLSYYELNAKVLSKTNEVVEQVNANTNVVDAINAEWPGIKSDAQAATASANAAASSANSGASAANAAAANANNVANTYAGTLNELDARISNIIANGQQTEGNTELIDIRVGYDSITYPTAGDAVRGQIGNIAKTYESDDFYEYDNFYVEVGANRLIENGVMREELRGDRASIPPFSYGFNSIAVKDAKYRVKIFGFSDKWYLIYDSANGEKYVDTTDYSKLCFQILSESIIPKTENYFFRLCAYTSISEAINDACESINESIYIDSPKNLFVKRDFGIGGIASGHSTVYEYRITNAEPTVSAGHPIKCKKGDTLKIKADLSKSSYIGCRVGIHEVSGDSFIFDSGWHQGVQDGIEYTVINDETIGVNLCFSFSETSTEVITNETEATSFISTKKLFEEVNFSVRANVPPSNAELSNRISEIESNLNERGYGTMNSYPMKSENTLSEFLVGDSTKQMQGAAVNGNVLYYSMTKDNALATIYAYDIINNVGILSVDGNYGHAGDMTYNPVTDEVIVINGKTSSADIFILYPSDLSLKRTVEIKTPGWRVGTIAFNPKTDGYVFELSRNNTWEDYKFAFADSEFNILSEFEPIKNGNLLQGIECDGKFIYAMYATPSNHIIVYDIFGNYRGFHKLSFNTESECIAKYNDTTFFVGENGYKKIYKMTLSYEWD